MLNCSFETGDFTDWDNQDITSPFFAQTVDGPTYVGYGFFTSAPSEGTVSALNGFDGDGPGTIELGQDVTLTADSIVTLQFDYRGAWDLASYGATEDREFIVSVEPAGGGTPLETIPILTAEAGTLETDTGLTTETVDLSAYSGQTVRFNFEWDIPETFSGPGFFEVDNVSVIAEPAGEPPAPTSVPAIGGGGLILLGAVLAAVAVTFLRRRKPA